MSETILVVIFFRVTFLDFSQINAVRVSQYLG